MLKKELIEENSMLRKQNIRLQNSLESYYHMLLYFREHNLEEEGTLFISVDIDTGGKLSSDFVTKDLFKNQQLYINNIHYKRCKEQPHIDSNFFKDEQ